MGKKIDAFVLTSAIGVGFYFYYLSAIGSKTLCVLLAFASCIIARKALRFICAKIRNLSFFRKRRIRQRTRGEIMRVACMDSDAAMECLSKLLKKHYREEIEAALIQRHPSQKLSPNAVFDIWKENRGKAVLAICATCQEDAECRAMAASLKAPKLALLDSDALSRLMTEHPECMRADEDHPVASGAKLRRLALLIFNRRNAPKNLLFALTMGGLYLLTANVTYLCCSFALLLIALISLRRAPMPDKLF